MRTAPRTVATLGFVTIGIVTLGGCALLRGTESPFRTDTHLALRERLREPDPDAGRVVGRGPARGVGTSADTDPRAVGSGGSRADPEPDRRRHGRGGGERRVTARQRPLPLPHGLRRGRHVLGAVLRLHVDAARPGVGLPVREAAGGRRRSHLRGVGDHQLGGATAAPGSSATVPLDGSGVDPSGLTTLVTYSSAGPDAAVPVELGPGKVLAVTTVRWSVPARTTNVRPVDGGSRSNAAGKVTATTPSGAPRSYVVAPDDLIGDVAARFGISVARSCG